MRIAELSRESGVPVPTIKYYLREGLLHPGELTSANQARYDASHTKRLQLIRTLVEIGRLPIAAIKEMLGELDSSDPDMHAVLGRALKNVSGPRELSRDDVLVEAQERTTALMERMGWEIRPWAPSWHAVAEAIAALQKLGVTEVLDRLDDYAEAVQRIAELDLETVRHQTEPEAVVYGAVIGTILGDHLITGMRRIAQESLSAKAFGRRQDDNCE